MILSKTKFLISMFDLQRYLMETHFWSSLHMQLRADLSYRNNVVKN